MDKFVLGFAFTEAKDLVLLVTKLRPKWQAGCLNGIGGKIEDGELAIQAMHREAKEEAGLSICWEYRGIMKGINNDDTPFECHIFYAYDDAVVGYRQTEDEPLKLHQPKDIQKMRVVNNLRFLIPYGMCEDGSSFIDIKY